MSRRKQAAQGWRVMDTHFSDTGEFPSHIHSEVKAPPRKNDGMKIDLSSKPQIHIYRLRTTDGVFFFLRRCKKTKHVYAPASDQMLRIQ